MARWSATGSLTAARLPSILFVALCGLEYLRAYTWNIKQAINKKFLWFLLAPLGLIVYVLYLAVVRGDFFAMLHAYSTTNDWTYQVFNPNIFDTLHETVLKIASALTRDNSTTKFLLIMHYPLRHLPRSLALPSIYF